MSGSILFITVLFVVSILILLFTLYYSKKKIVLAVKESKRIKDESKRELKKIKETEVKEAINNWKIKNRNEKESLNRRKRELREMENLYNKRLNTLDSRLKTLENKENYISSIERRLEKREKRVDQKEKETERLNRQSLENLEKISQMTRYEAEDVLFEKMVSAAKIRTNRELKEAREKLEITANEQAANILSTAMQRLAVDQVTETTVNVVTLPNDEMKGRIIGREGRNIRALEMITGVDVIVDDTPGAVVLSCFDPVRREVAKQTLQKLISDGRIHPTRIEQIANKVKKEIKEKMLKIGQDTCLEMNIRNISQNLVKLIGRLYYRTSHGQSILKHSVECGYIARMIAAELHLDQRIAKRAGFLHDIGKAIDHTMEGTHASIGASVARKNGESRIIVNAIEAHHEEVEINSIYTVITQIADAISGARPGARRDFLGAYIQRLEQLEKIATSVEGVNKSYAIQAGRELRVIVNPGFVKDSEIGVVVNDIIQKIESEVQYPGQIKVTVIRERRVSGVAT